MDILLYFLFFLWFFNVLWTSVLKKVLNLSFILRLYYFVCIEFVLYHYISINSYFMFVMSFTEPFFVSCRWS